jgi:hypothetical protein
VEGLIFYCICSILIFGLVKTSDHRRKLVFILIGLVIFGRIQLTIDNSTIYLSYIILVLTSFYYVSFYTFYHQLYILICTLIVGMTYSSLFIIQIYDPASFIFNPFIMISLILLLTILILCKKNETRVLVLLIGFSLGEILNYLIFKSINLNYSFGTVAWLDSLSFIFLLMVCLEWIKRNISLLLSKKQNSKAEI